MGFGEPGIDLDGPPVGLSRAFELSALLGGRAARNTRRPRILARGGGRARMHQQTSRSAAVTALAADPVPWSAVTFDRSRRAANASRVPSGHRTTMRSTRSSRPGRNARASRIASSSCRR